MRRSFALLFSPVVAGCGLLLDLSAIGPKEGGEEASASLDAAIEGGQLSLPRAGVYQYKEIDPPDAGAGFDRTEIAGAGNMRVDHEALVDAVISAAGEGCFAFTLWPTGSHKEVMRYCVRGGKLVTPVDCGVQQQQMLGQPTLTEFTCGADEVILTPANDVGTLTMSAVEKNNQLKFKVSGPIRVVDRAPFVVGSATVDAIHVRIVRQHTGNGSNKDNQSYDIKGDEQTELWFAARDAMILRWTRSVSVTTELTLPILGKVTVRYDESTGYTLSQIDPVRDAGAD